MERLAQPGDVAVAEDRPGPCEKGWLPLAEIDRLRRQIGDHRLRSRIAHHRYGATSGRAPSRSFSQASKRVERRRASASIAASVTNVHEITSWETRQERRKAWERT